MCIKCTQKRQRGKKDSDWETVEHVYGGLRRADNEAIKYKTAGSFL
jgi:hypothetical protein